MTDYMPAGAWPEDEPAPADETVIADETFETGAAVCSEIMLYLASRMVRLPPGAVLEVVSADEDAKDDIPNWCALRGYRLLRMFDDEHGRRHYLIRQMA